MGSRDLTVAIESHFTTQWAGATPIKYDNVPFPTEPIPWVSLEIVESDSNKASLGGGVQLRRTVGVVSVDVYTLGGAEGQGSFYARQLADSVKAIFRDKQLTVGTGQVTFYEGKVKRIGEEYWAATGSTTGTTQWYQLLVSIPFFYDEYI